MPSVDLVVFHEPIPSDIRAIQRRGRTGRDSVGRIVVLVTEATRDEAFAHAEASRERKMRGVVRGMARRGRARGPTQRRQDAMERPGDGLRHPRALR